ncbi:lipid-A-disaccharide synthase [Flavisolibacter ginsenosidimutans]|uniref:Lipid-A-disaccharide synthase n=1 Tax=Flavisolibacter ginsenosidimutans TaxID=661481 RepID=A0A5B8UIF3_9BACT|nr:lipid-A-disaccharide synthase [Flavisolibacter ginsenosidimutans]QEC56457.1 lipid-A-disaccharide synthase [Flavisolibacter ginsenosidimutans]
MIEEKKDNPNLSLPFRGRGGKYYLIAGEASGDLHGSNLIKEIKKLDTNAVIRCWGGDLMQAAGATVVKHYKELAFMGFIEVVKNLPTILNNLKFCKEDVQSFSPDVLVLIDYPGFNLRIAEWAKRAGFKVIYYISPQVWAWKESRVKDIKKYVDKMLVILPFEKEFYKKWDYKVEYIGHPLVQVIEEAIHEKKASPLRCFSSSGDEKTVDASFKKELIALLPGSRQQEIAVKLPLMLEASKAFPNYQFIVAQAPAQPTEFYQRLLANYPGVLIAKSGQTYSLLTKATAALVTSGTATLETALFGVPQVVCYKGSNISYQIAKRLVKIKYISLVNLIMDKPVVKELIQAELTPQNITTELNDILHNPQRIAQIKTDYAALKNLLRKEGNASARAAQEIVGFLQTNA